MHLLLWYCIEQNELNWIDCCASVQEDIPWEWEQIFTEVSSELMAEWEQQEIPEE